MSDQRAPGGVQTPRDLELWERMVQDRAMLEDALFSLLRRMRRGEGPEELAVAVHYARKVLKESPLTSPRVIEQLEL